ncbi:hypothetical protein J1605_017070 [Eschrichtius robustus]|uniref:Uncharacterized protein n=1 Tax=Eschrichtius robustus TaxID=9764 RepID=A0AB34I0K1_ESCRO|nr:hypothetical protein J1605_017070 [Eschrichtius robustus]
MSGFHICIDKGTFDAISLNPDNAIEKRKQHVKSLSRSMASAGQAVATVLIHTLSGTPLGATVSPPCFGRQHEDPESLQIPTWAPKSWEELKRGVGFQGLQPLLAGRTIELVSWPLGQSFLSLSWDPKPVRQMPILTGPGPRQLRARPSLDPKTPSLEASLTYLPNPQVRPLPPSVGCDPPRPPWASLLCSALWPSASRCLVSGSQEGISGPSAAYTGSPTDGGTSNGASHVPTALTLRHGSELCDSRVGLGPGCPAQSLAHHRCPVLSPLNTLRAAHWQGMGTKPCLAEGPQTGPGLGEDRKGGFRQHFSQSYQQQINEGGGREMKKSFPESLKPLGARLEEPKPASFKWHFLRAHLSASPQAFPSQQMTPPATLAKKKKESSLIPNFSDPSANPVCFTSITHPTSAHASAMLLASGLDTAAATNWTLDPLPWPLKSISSLIKVTSTQHHSDSTISCLQVLYCVLLNIKTFGTSLVAQWLRIRLPMQGTRVRALAREDPTCRGATKPMRHNY